MAILDCPKGVVVHTTAIISLPGYLLVRYYLDNSYFGTTSVSWLAGLTALWLWWVTRISFFFFTHPLRHLPTPPGSLLLGNLDFNGGRPPTDNISRHLENTPNDGLITFWMPLYFRAQLFPTKPETLMEILNIHNYDWEKPAQGKRILRRTLGSGLVDVEGNEHKAMRKVVAPAFSGKHIRELIPLFYSKGVALAKIMALEAQRSDHVVEVSSHMHRVTLDIIGAAGVGEDFNSIEDDSHPLAQKYETITSTGGKNPLLHLLFRFILPPWIGDNMRGTPFPEITRTQQALRRDAALLMQQKKKILETHKEQQKDIIAIIMRSGDFSEDYLVSQLLTFLAAGHDTTASALTWTLWLLATRPHMQTRLRQECIDHLAGKDAMTIDPAVFDVENMPYLTAVCNETLRLYPTVPGTMRVAIKDTKIGDLRVPKGTTALISPWAVNRSTALWGEDANEYKPERWIDGPNAAHGGAPSATALLTFLHGPRSCIGQAFARSEMKVVLAAIMLKFRFEVSDPTEKVVPVGFVTIKPRNGMKLRLHELRNGLDMQEKN